MNLLVNIKRNLKMKDLKLRTSHYQSLSLMTGLKIFSVWSLTTRRVNVIFIYFSEAWRRRRRRRRRRRAPPGNPKQYQEIRDQINPELKAELDTDLTTETDNDPEDEMGTELENDPRAEV